MLPETEPTVPLASKAKFDGTADCISAASPFITPRMPLFKSSAALMAAPAPSSIPPASPWVSISPTHAISLDGEEMPKKPLILLSRFEQKPLTLFHSQLAAFPMPFQMPLIRFRPIFAIWDTPPAKPFTMAEMICGTAFTISTMIFGRLAIRATKSCTPARMILSMFPTRTLMMLVMICGIAPTMVVMMVGRF